MEKLLEVSSEQKINTLNNWLNNEGKEITRELKEFPKNNPRYIKKISDFVKELKLGPLGEVLVCYIKDLRLTDTGVYVINALIMEPRIYNFQFCPHPLKPKEKWEIVLTIKKENINIDLEIGLLFQTTYLAAPHERYFSGLLKLEHANFQLLEKTFEEKLRQSGGQLLLHYAKKNFESDIEKTLLNKLIELSEEVQTALKKEKESIVSLEMDLNEKQKEFDEREIKLDNESREWLKIYKKIQELKSLEDHNVNEELGESHNLITHEELLKTLQTLIYHNSDDDLIYDETIIEMFLRAIQSNTLVIFSGPSGTGKSSIVSAIGGAIKGAKVHMIPVQSSWTDTQDLLGYFNPIDKCYVASPFMEALADAKQDSENLHLICLDEMNLAHVEYYFSEFLSAREKEKPSIRLYSKRYFTSAKSLIDNMTAENKFEEKYVNAAELIDRYDYDFLIPENVRFIGTINMDHTVKPLSPKVIDRSFIIELGHLERNNREKIERELKASVKVGAIDISLEELSKALHDEEVIKNEAQKIMDLSHQLDAIPNAPLNSRGYKQLVGYLSRTPEQERTLEIENKYIDQLVSTKLLPRIELARRDSEGTKAVENFKASLKDYPHSLRKLESMLEDERIIRFW